MLFSDEKINLEEEITDEFDEDIFTHASIIKN